MGRRWRRVTEAVRQNAVTQLPGDAGFEATSNARCEAMEREAIVFETKLKLVIKDVYSLMSSTQGVLGRVHTVLTASQPRTYEASTTDPLGAEPEGCHHMLGDGVDFERLGACANDTMGRLESDVVRPLQLWIVELHTTKGKMRELEALRLEVDSRRRQVLQLEEKYEQLREVDERRGGPQRYEHEQQLNMAYHILTHKEGKLNSLLQYFHESEQAIAEAFGGLIRDATVLRDYIQAELVIFQECFRCAHSTFPPSDSNNAEADQQPSTTARTVGFPSIHHLVAGGGTHWDRVSSGGGDDIHGRDARRGTGPAGSFRGVGGSAGVHCARQDTRTHSDGLCPGSTGAKQMAGSAGIAHVGDGGSRGRSGGGAVQTCVRHHDSGRGADSSSTPAHGSAHMGIDAGSSHGKTAGGRSSGGGNDLCGRDGHGSSGRDGQGCDGGHAGGGGSAMYGGDRSAMGGYYKGVGAAADDLDHARNSQGGGRASAGGSGDRAEGGGKATSSSGHGVTRRRRGWTVSPPAQPGNALTPQGRSPTGFLRNLGQKMMVIWPGLPPPPRAPPASCTAEGPNGWGPGAVWDAPDVSAEVMLQPAPTYNPYIARQTTLDAAAS